MTERSESGVRARVLIVDDMPSNIEVANAALERDYDVRFALSGSEALELVERQVPDLILLDLMMPGLSGFDVLRRLRAEPRTRELPVIMLTADTTEESEIEGFGLGADDFITKPFVRARLLARVRNLIERQMLRRETARLTESAAQREIEAVREQLAAARDRLDKAAKLEFLGKLVASFAHDIGSPIGNSAAVADGLQAGLVGLRQAFAGNALSRSVLEQFLGQSGTGLELITRNLGRAHELLESFKQQALDQASAQTRRINLAAWLRDLLYTATPMLAATQHRVVQQVPDDLSLATQPGPLAQVLINLLNNAILHAFEGMSAGTVTITAQRLADERLELRIDDDGCGMSPEVQARLFEPFFTTKTGRGGTGLGMDIVRHIVVEVLAGELEVHSAPGAGSSFRLRFPSGSSD